MARRVSDTAKRLSAELEKRGEPGSPRQLERWRQAGLIPRVRQRGAGRGRGSTVELAEEAIEQAIDAARLVRQYPTLHAAALAMFGEGRFRVEKPELDRAYERYLGDLEAKLLAATPTSGLGAAALAVGARIAAKTSRRRDYAEMRERLKGMREVRFIPLALMLESLYEDVALIFLTGRPTSRLAFAELLEATGVTAITTERPPGQPPLVSSLPDLTAELLTMSAPTLAALARKTPLEDLESARDFLNALLGFARLWVPPVRKLFPDAFGFAALLSTSPVAVALATPVVARLESQFPGELAKSKRLFRDSITGRM